MAACALVFRSFAGLEFNASGIRIDLEFLICDEATGLKETDGVSVFFAVGATVNQIKSAMGTAVRDRASSFWGLTIPPNEIIVPDIDKI